MMENIVPTGSLPQSGSFAVPNAVWTEQAGWQVALSAARGGRSAATLAGHPGCHVRIRNLVNPISDLSFADRMRASASEP
ncbi:MAG: hypothetical protein ABR608_11955 [Pseudonocardiaceae bacterium]